MVQSTAADVTRYGGLTAVALGRIICSELKEENGFQVILSSVKKRLVDSTSIAFTRGPNMSSHVCNETVCYERLNRKFQ